MAIYFVLITALVLGIGSTFLFKEDDSHLEEFSEEIIEHELNLPEGSIDLTPATKEKE